MGHRRPGSVSFGVRAAALVAFALVLLAPGAAHAERTLAAGTYHACAVVGTGSISCWGDGGSGKLGNGAMDPSNVPVTVTGITDAVQVAAGRDSTCAVLAGGSVKCWGAGGLLGDGTWASASPTPVTVTGIGDAVQVSVGVNHSCAALTGGAVKCWGTNNNGSLGSTSTEPSFGYEPVAIAGITDAVEVAAGQGFTCALRATGGVACWGVGSSGQMGNGSSTLANVTPVPVSNVDDAVQVSAHHDSACALRKGAVMSCWGKGTTGQLGNGFSTSNVPKRVNDVANGAYAGVGFDHACGLRATGAVSCWGDGSKGQLGTAVGFSDTPLAIGSVAGATQVSSGLDYSCALLSGGTVTCWGLNDGGQLGNGTDDDPRDGVPTTVSGLSGVKQAPLPDTSGGDDEGPDDTGPGDGDDPPTDAGTGTTTTTPAPPAPSLGGLTPPTPVRSSTPAKAGFPASRTSRSFTALGKGTTFTVSALRAGTTARVRVMDGTRSLGLVSAKVGANGRAALKVRLSRAERRRLVRLRRKSLTLRFSVTDASGKAVKATRTVKLT